MLKFKTRRRVPPNAVYVEPTTGYRVPWTGPFQDVLNTVKEHKRIHDIQLTEDWEQQVEHQLAMTLKVSNPDDWIEDTEKPYIPRLVQYGRDMWAELHAKALAYPDQPSEMDKVEIKSWYDGWCSRIPSAKCECAYKWKRLANEPDFSSRKSFYLWSVEMHDLITETLGKPRMEGEFRHKV